jgi:predicted AAA+ superfamily ATPase
MKKITLPLMLATILIISSCNTTRTQRGAMIGAGTGAAVGAVIGSASGNTGVGAAVGTVVGGTAGAIIGKQMDKQAAEIERQVPNAEVIHNEGEHSITVNFSSAVLFQTAKYNLSSQAKSTINDLATIHKYANWSLELKNIYDSYPKLKVVFTGSSILDIIKGSADLSRRAIIYKLHGLSFREYLKLFHNYDVPVFSLEQIINNDVKLTDIEHPLPLFKDYLKRGYYPFGIENNINIRLGQVIVQTLETDIPQYANLSVGTARKLKRLLSIIAESVPFKPNFTKIAEMIGVSRNSLDDYFLYMEQAGLIIQLRDETGGIRGLGKVDKVYLDNTNIIYNLVGSKSNAGNIRETFFLNQMRVKNEVVSAKKADFVVNEYTFELGGKNKQQQQVKKDGKSFVVKDNIEFGYLNVIPLWAFGLNY